MVWLNGFFSSLVVRITALTLAALTLMFAGTVLLAQSPLLTHALYLRALSENDDSLAQLVWLLESSPDAIEPDILSVYNNSFRVAAISDDFGEGLAPRSDMLARLADVESDAVSSLQGRDIRFQMLGALPLQDRLSQAGAESMSVFASVQVAIELSDGRVLNVWLAPVQTLKRQRAVVVGAGLALVLFSIALGLAIAAVMLRPIRRLERDAARLSLGDAGAAVSETGPAELQRLSAALNRMRERLTALIREREQIVAAIAHDVRTGLTRIRLRMDESGAARAGEIEGDLAQMEALISDMLAYARAESPSGPKELIRLEEFMSNIAQTAPYPIEVSLPEGADFLIAGDPIALRRLFENLIENARRYGGGEIAIRVLAFAGGRDVRIEDNGPGLPEDQLETVFQPFQRSENSRNRATGGTGLGLGIARAIAQAHGATLRVENRPEGGLAAIVHFPEALRT